MNSMRPIWAKGGYAFVSAQFLNAITTSEAVVNFLG